MIFVSISEKAALPYIRITFKSVRTIVILKSMSDFLHYGKGKTISNEIFTSLAKNI